jgi:hypothetical protein
MMSPKDSRGLRIQGAFLVAALVLQYLLGMYVDLFVPFPEGLAPDQLWAFSWSEPALAAHIVLATLLLLGAVVLCIRALLRRDNVWIIASVTGLAALIAAGLSGAQFIPTQNDVFSYLMAVTFIVAILAYGWGIYASHRRDARFEPEQAFEGI